MAVRLPWCGRQAGCKDERAQLRLRAADTPCVSVKLAADIVFREEEAVCVMALEITPQVLYRVEFRRIPGEALDVKPREPAPELLDEWSLVDGRSIPQEYDVSTKMEDEHPDKVGDMRRIEVFLLEADIESQVMASCGNGKDGKRRDAVMLPTVANDRRLSLRSPGAAPRGNEHEAALVEKDKVGAKSCGFFFIAGHLYRFQWAIFSSSR